MIYQRLANARRFCICKYSIATNFNGSSSFCLVGGNNNWGQKNYSRIRLDRDCGPHDLTINRLSVSTLKHSEQLLTQSVLTHVIEDYAPLNTTQELKLHMA